MVRLYLILSVTLRLAYATFFKVIGVSWKVSAISERFLSRRVGIVDGVFFVEVTFGMNLFESWVFNSLNSVDVT